MGQVEASSPRDSSAVHLAAEAMVQMAGLAGQEFALAKAELRHQGRHLGVGGSLLATAAFAGVTAWLVLVAAAIAAIAVVLPVWAAALIVFGALGLAGGGLALIGGRRIAHGLPPLPLTTESIRRDFAQIKDMGRGDGKP